MKLEDKRNILETYCYGKCCDNCKANTGLCPVRDDPTDVAINDAFRAVFGEIDEDKPVAELCEIAEDSDKVIKIKSDQAIDSVTIYFKNESEVEQ